MPYYGKFSDELRPGQTIFIKGFLKGVNFDIGLYCGKRVAGPDRNDIALLLAGRLEEAGTSIFSMIDGEWGTGEKIKLGISYKSSFSLRIRTREDCFEVWSQGRKLIDFTYAVPLNLVQYMYIVGEIDLYRCDWEGRYYPDPFCCYLPPGALSPGKTLYVTGFVLSKADCLIVGIRSKEEFALHFDVKVKRTTLNRWKKYKTVYQASQELAKQQQMSRSFSGEGDPGVDAATDNPDMKILLQRAQTFELMVEVEEDTFNIYIDGKLSGAYAHMCPIEAIDNFFLQGDIEIHAASWS